MKNTLNKIGSYLFIGLIVAVLTGIGFNFVSCKKETTGIPVITRVRTIKPDSTITEGGFGQMIDIQGSHLAGAKHIYFNNVEATFNPTLNTDNNIIVSIPSSFPLEITNKVRVVTDGGEANFTFTIGVPVPVIRKARFTFGNPNTIYLGGEGLAQIKSIKMGSVEIPNFTYIGVNGDSLSFAVPASVTSADNVISITAVAGNVDYPFDLNSAAVPVISQIQNEWAVPGDTFTLKGVNMAFLTSVKFNGVTIDLVNCITSPTYDALKFIVPVGIGSGDANIEVSNSFGKANFTFKNQQADIMIFNMDDKKACWGKMDTAYTMPRPISGNYAQWTGDIVPSWWDQEKYLCACDTALRAPFTPSQWAIKFELNVLKPWAITGSFRITLGDPEGSLVDYVPYTASAPFQTEGWITVTIPLTSFQGPALNGSKDLGVIRFKLFNPGSALSPIRNVNISVDNVRLVKVQ
jgi:hypothetical protein